VCSLGGAAAACLGFLGGILHDAASTVVGIAILLCIIVSLASLDSLRFIYSKQPHLRLWLRLLNTLGASIEGFIDLILAVVLSTLLHSQGTYFENFLEGG
jgi:hypothetical protein